MAAAGLAGRLEKLPSRILPGGLVLLEARTLASRMLGLALLDGLPSDHALLIDPCRSVHTFGMRFDIDVVFLRADWSVARIAPRVPSGRLLVCRGGRRVIETRAGASARFLAAGVAEPTPPA